MMLGRLVVPAHTSNQEGMAPTPLPHIVWGWRELRESVVGCVATPEGAIALRGRSGRSYATRELENGRRVVLGWDANEVALEVAA